MKRSRGSSKSNKKKKHSKDDTANSGSKYLDIKDLKDVLNELKQFSEIKWEEFGLEAGLYKKTLENIEANKTKVEDRFVECLSCWLRRNDNVDDKGMPSWRRLVQILEELGERALADTIRDRKEVSSDVHKQQQVEPLITPGHSICLPPFLENEYLRMTTEFANILKRFVIQVFKENGKLKSVQISLVGIKPSNKKEINEVQDETDLIEVLRNYCSLWKFPILSSLAKDMKMADITEELNEFEEKRKELYNDILAKDFAKSAIEYCGTINSREMTFEVLWSIDETTLDDFEQFLAAAFHSQGFYMLIHLKTVHNSRLTFVCIIPHWLVDEMKDYIIDNKDLFISKGVVEITVDRTIVFKIDEQLLEAPCEEIVMLPTGVKEAITYAGLIYYEEKGVENLVTFTVAKKLDALLEYVKKEHPQAELGHNVSFSFDPSSDYIELKFDTPQKKPFTGWTIEPHVKPCRLYRHDIHNFGEANYPIPPSCLISVYGSPDAVPTLHYSIPLVGVADPVSLYIRRAQRNPPPSTVHESTAVSSTGGASPSATVDVNKVKKVINDVLVSHDADLNSLPKKFLSDLSHQLYTTNLISDKVSKAPSMEECIDEFKAGLSLMRKLPEVQEHCQKFINSFIAVRGSYAKAAEALQQDWIEAIKNELGFDFNINI